MPARARVPRWALVWALVFAVVGMHHIGTQEPAGHHATAGAQHAHEGAEPDPGRDSGHDVLHLCLAILVAGLALTLALLGRSDGPHQRTRGFTARTARLRAPPPRTRGAPALLATLCVLRL